MMKLQATSTAQPTVTTAQPTQPQPAQTKPSFKGSDEAHDTWTKNKQDFEEISNNSQNPSVVKKLGKAGVVITTGIVGYGTAKFGFRKTFDIISAMVTSKQVQEARAKVTGFVNNTLIPKTKGAFSAVKNANITKKTSQKFEEALAFAKQSRAGRFASERYAQMAANMPSIGKSTTFAQKRKIVTCMQAAKKAGVKVETKFTQFKAFIASKIPTGEQIKNGAIETLAIGSGMAAATTAAGFKRSEG